MPIKHLPLAALPAWAALNGVGLDNAAVRDADTDVTSQPKRGLGLFLQHPVKHDGDSEVAVLLLKVPAQLVLSAVHVDEYAKAESKFGRLLHAVDRRSARMDILLFLLSQYLRARADPSSHQQRLPAPTPWAEYVRFLPSTVPLPTLWPLSDIALLRGTSLEPAVAAKLRALEAEFALLESVTRDMPFWDDLLWQSDERFSLHDWMLLDAWFRSRSVEIPGLGSCMVPVLDMANHSREPNAYYERIDVGGNDDSVVLLARPGAALDQGQELIISYGASKSAAEMLFSYGFVDSRHPETDSMVLPASSLVLDDPLAKAKVHVFPTAPTVVLTRTRDGPVMWTCPFAYLAMLGHDDGLNFQLLRAAEADAYEDELCVFWREEDVTGRAGEIAALLKGDDMEKVVELRVRVVLRGLLDEHLNKMREVAGQCALRSEPERSEAEGWAEQLRNGQMAMVEEVVGAMEREIEQLAQDKSVQQYLASQRQDEMGDEVAEPYHGDTDRRDDEEFA